MVICVGYDMVEYHPEQWNPDCCKIHRSYRCAPPRKSMSTTSWKWVCWATWEKRCGQLLGRRDLRKVILSGRYAKRLSAR